MTTKSKAIRQHAKTRLPSQHWLLILTRLISMASYSCGGACACKDARAFGISLLPSPDHCFIQTSTPTMLPFRSASSNAQNSRTAPLQRSRHNPTRSSQVLLAHASNWLQKAIVPKVRMDRSGNGTYQASLTCDRCSRTEQRSTVTSRSGTCLV